MEFLRSRINAVDAAIRVYQGVRTEYLKADEDATGTKHARIFGASPRIRDRS